MDPRFFRKFADLITEAEAPAEEKQLFTLRSEMGGSRQLNTTPSRAKEIARGMVMQQQLGSWYELVDSNNEIVASHGKGPSATRAEEDEKQPFKLSSGRGVQMLFATPTEAKRIANGLMGKRHLGNWYELTNGNDEVIAKWGKRPEKAEPQPTPDEEPEDPNNPKYSIWDPKFYDQNDGGLTQADIDAAIERLSNPRVADKSQGDTIDGEYDVVDDEQKQLSKVNEVDIDQITDPYNQLVKPPRPDAYEPQEEKLPWKKRVLAKYPSAEFVDPRKLIPRDGSYYTQAIVDGKVVGEEVGNQFTKIHREWIDKKPFQFNPKDHTMPAFRKNK